MPNKINIISEDHLGINKLAYEEGLKALKQQENKLDNLRQRASGIAALSGLVATFLGKESFNQISTPEISASNFRAIELIAISLFIISIVVVIEILRPRKGWIFYFGPKEIINQFGKGPKATSLSKTYEKLAFFSVDNYKTNQKILDNLNKWYLFALILVIAQIVLWLISMIN